MQKEATGLGDIAVITSGKGGTGKSTITSGCGAALAKRGKKVLLIDTDAGLRCLDLILGVSDITVNDLGDVLGGNCAPASAIYSIPSCPGLFLMAAPGAPNFYGEANDMKRLCRGLARYYDYILIDSPAGVDIGFKFAVSAAHAALVVVTPDPLSIRDSERVGRLLSREGITRKRLVINKYKNKVLKYGGISDLDSVIDSTKIRLIAIIPEDEKILKCHATGSIIEGKSPGAVCLNNLSLRIEGIEVPLYRF